MDERVKFIACQTRARPCLRCLSQRIRGIGIALEDALADEGYTVAGPFASRSSACASLEDNTPDLALLDLLLRDGPCVELARTLRRRDVPGVFFSGFTPAEGGLPLDLQDLPWIEKPI